MVRWNNLKPVRGTDGLKRFWGSGFLWIFAMMVCMVLCCACGKKEEEQQGIGIDGYAYLAEKLTGDFKDVSPWNWLRIGDQLYYYKGTGSIGKGSVEELDFTLTRIKSLDSHYVDYAVDQTGGCYLYFTTDASAFGRKPAILRIPVGADSAQEIYECDEVPQDIAVCTEGHAHLLMEDGILTLDGEGKEVAFLPRSQSPWGAIATNAHSSEKLMNDLDGSLYFCIEDEQYRNHIWLLRSCGTNWEELKDLPGGRYLQPYSGFGGKLFVKSDGMLYEYDSSTGKSREVFRFTDSGLIDSSVLDLLPLDEERILVIYSGEDSPYLLRKVPIEEMPSRQTIVLASLQPAQDLREAVSEFNRSNEEYRVVIDRFGAGEIDENDKMETARIRLDASLLGSASPDILDLDWLDFGKYALKDALEDLTPYLEQSESLQKEDFLENVIDGFTVNDRLVSIPSHFYLHALVGRKSQIGAYDGWSFEEVRAFTEKYEGDRFLHRNYMLYYFCYPYYMDTFIDWESGTCSFDSQGFQDLVRWIEKTGYTDFDFNTGRIPDNVLLEQEIITSFPEMEYLKMMFGDEVVLVADMTADKSLSYTVQLIDELAIVAGSRHKEGAWAFLEYCLTREEGSGSNGFSTNKARLQEAAARAMKEIVEKDENGRVIYRSPHSTYYIDGEWIPVYSVPEEEVELLLDSIQKADFSQVSTVSGVTPILVEELGHYFSGERSLEEVTEIINSRVQLLINEQL